MVNIAVPVLAGFDAGLAAGFELRSTTGATADWVLVDAGAAEGGGGAGGAVVVVVVVVVLLVTVRAGAAAGFVATWAVRVDVRVRATLLVELGTVALLSVVTGGVSVVVAGAASTVGGGAGVVTGAGSVGGVAWADKGVEESARAAAIAERALVRAQGVVLIIIMNNRALERASHDYRSVDL